MKITTGAAGVNVTWNRKVAYPGRGVGIGARMLNVAAMVIGSLAIAMFLSAGRSVSAILVALVVGGSLAAFVINCKICGRRKARARIDSRPLVDWPHVFAMEMEVYGETFRHDGAPANFPIAAAADAKKAIRYIGRAEVRRYGSQLCAERGYHIHMLGAAGCLVCDGDR